MSPYSNAEALSRVTVGIVYLLATLITGFVFSAASYSYASQTVQIPLVSGIDPVILLASPLALYTVIYIGLESLSIRLTIFLVSLGRRRHGYKINELNREALNGKELQKRKFLLAKINRYAIAVKAARDYEAALRGIERRRMMSPVHSYMASIVFRFCLLTVAVLLAHKFGGGELAVFIASTSLVLLHADLLLRPILLAEWELIFRPLPLFFGEYRLNGFYRRLVQFLKKTH